MHREWITAYKSGPLALGSTAAQWIHGWLGSAVLRFSNRRRKVRLRPLALAMIAVMAVGCGGEGETSKSQTSSSTEAGTSPSSSGGQGMASVDPSGPQAVVTAFLDAFKAGNPEATGQYLTQAAREDAQRHGMEIAPPGSPGATFVVGEWEYVSDEKDKAHVASTFTENYSEGEALTQNVVWMVRQDGGDWKIHGMATRVFEDLPPLFLDFENQEDMQQKLALAQQEAIRRMQAQIEEAKNVLAPTKDVQ
jgi:hypothetical protein